MNTATASSAFTEIQNLLQFEAYCQSRGLHVFASCEIAGDGFYAQVKKGTAQVQHFTQVRLSKAHWHFGKSPITGTCEWVRLSFRDLNNEYILQAK